MFRRVACIAWLLVAIAATGGCSATSGTVLLATQQEPVNATEIRSRLFYIGLALYSEPWSENDVVELGSRLHETSKFDVVPLIASNVVSRPRTYPPADDAVIAQLIRRTAQLARPDDLVFVGISTHGARKMLARQFGRNPPTALTARELARIFAPLAGHRMVLIISACHSGSLIADLRAPDRIIIAAARADRSSFGCAPGNRHTLFGEAGLRAFDQPGRSLRQVFTAIRQDVARMERESDYTPSEPQVSIGAQVEGLYDEPLF